MKTTKLGLLILLACTMPFMIRAQKVDPLESITSAELRDHVFFLASDELEGRNTGSKGYAIAAMYAATQFRQSVLEPIITGNDGKKTFFQSVPMLSYYVSVKSVFSISSDTGKTNVFHKDKMVLFSNPTVKKDIFVDENPVFLGYGIDDPEIGWSDYNEVDVRGKIVIVVGGAPSKNGKPVFPKEKDEFYRNFGQSAGKRLDSASDHDVSAIVFIPDPVMAENWAGNVVNRMVRQQFNVRISDEGSKRSEAIFLMHPDILKEMLTNAGYDWKNGDYDYKPGVLKNIRVSCTVEKDDEESINCNNIVAMLPGTDPKLKDEYIVLNGHLDHLGVNRGGEIRNGADDNASGCAAILEIAEALAMKPTKRSIIFALFTGEERGLLGSEWFVNHLPVPPDKIILNANIDMIGRKSDGKPDVIYVVARGWSKDRIIEITRRANDLQIKMPLDFSQNETDLIGVLGGDSKSFLSKKIPSVAFSRGAMPPAYHMPDDDAETLDYIKIENAARLIYVVLDEAGNE